MDSQRDLFLEKIKGNIAKYGHHITMVSGEFVPRYAYTIGVSEKLGYELIFAGGILFMQNEVFSIINEIISQLKLRSNSKVIHTHTYGSFIISKVRNSWSRLLLLGVFDYYNLKEVQAMQIIPDSEHFTLDVPDMSSEWDEKAQPVWKWLSKNWDYKVPVDSKVVTNIDALKGEKITEVMRWEENEWEAFAGSGPEVEKENIRVIPIGTLLGIDTSLEPIVNLKIGKGIWRDADELIWNEWN